MGTRASYIAQFEANVNYETDATGNMASLFIQACRMLRALTPERSASAQGGLLRFESAYSLTTIEKMEEQAIRWLNGNVTDNAAALLATAQAPRQFGLNRLRRDHLPGGPPEWANYNN